MCEVHTSPHQRKFTLLLRWIGVLPVGVLGGIVGYWLPKLVYTGMVAFIGFNVGIGSFIDYLIEFMANLASAGLMIYAGCRVAPSHHRVVFGVLAGMIAIFHVQPALSLFEHFRLMVLLRITGTVAGTLGGMSVLNDVDDTEMPPVDPALIEFEHVESFLANEQTELIRTLAYMGQEAIAQCIKVKHSLPTAPRDIAPDTVEANEQATSDADLWDRVEEKVAELREIDEEAWQSLKQTIPKITPNVSESDLTRFERRGFAPYI